MENPGYSLSDFRAAVGDMDGFGAGGGALIWVIFMAIIFMGGGGFGFGSRFTENPVSESDLCNSQNFNNLQNAVGRLSDQSWNTQMMMSRAVCDLGYASQAQANEIQRIIMQGDAATLQQLRDCCCSIERGIDSVNYNGAINTNSIIQAQQAGVQRILDYLCGQENQRLRDENMRGYIHDQFCGVVRYPQASTWTAGPSPCFGGYGCGSYDRGCCGTSF